jgi:hypothetical protein
LRLAKGQKQRAQRLSIQLDQQAPTQENQLELVLEPCQMKIQLDAWNILERDAWGRSYALRRADAPSLEQFEQFCSRPADAPASSLVAPL